jgi:hypothetical protein
LQYRRAIRRLYEFRALSFALPAIDGKGCFESRYLIDTSLIDLLISPAAGVEELLFGPVMGSSNLGPQLQL